MILDHPLHLEHLRHPEQGWELVLCHGDLAPVHVVQDGADLVSLHVLTFIVRMSLLSLYNLTAYLQEHNRVLTGAVHEQLLKVV